MIKKDIKKDLDMHPTPVPDYIGHRQRMMSKLIDYDKPNLSELEILELILMRAIPRIDVKPIAKKLLNQYVTLRNVLSADVNELSQFKGIKTSAITLFKLIDCASLQMVKPVQQKKVALLNWPQILDYCRLNLSHKTQEHLYIIHLDVKKRIIICDEFQKGSKNRIQIYPQEIMKRALNLGTDSILMVHNHPSGEAMASKEDINQTEDLADFLSQIGISIYDHLVVGNNKVYSINKRTIIDEL